METCFRVSHLSFSLFHESLEADWVPPRYSLPQGDKATQREAVRQFVYGSDPEPPSSIGATTTTSAPAPTATTTAPPPAV